MELGLTPLWLSWAEKFDEDMACSTQLKQLRGWELKIKHWDFETFLLFILNNPQQSLSLRRKVQDSRINNVWYEMRTFEDTTNNLMEYKDPL